MFKWALASFCVALAQLTMQGAHADGARLVLSDLDYPEGVYLHNERLYFTEMNADRVMAANANGGAFSQVWAQSGCGPTSISALGPERFLITCHLSGGLAIWDAKANNTMMVAASRSGRLIKRPNDSTADGQGGAFFSDSGEFAPDAPREGRVYHYSAGGVDEVIGGLFYANGVAYDAAAGVLYVSEHLGRKVLKIADPLDAQKRHMSVFWDYAARPCSQTGASRWLFGPDGLELRPNGGLFVAIYGGDAVYELDADGACAAVHSIPAVLVTSSTYDAARGALWVVAPGLIEQNSIKGGLFELFVR